MAASHTIGRCLTEFCANWGRGSNHVEMLIEIWHREFEHTPDKALVDAVYRLIRESSSAFPPPTGAVVDMVKAQMVSGSHVDLTYEQCSHCNPQGFRDVAIHYSKCPDGWHKGKPYCWVFTVNCNCPMGRRRNGPDVIDIEQKIRKSIALGRNHIRTFYINEHGKSLAMDHRMLEEDYQSWKNQQQNPNNPYRKMLYAQ